MDFKPFELFDEQNHLQPLFDKIEFDKLHGWDFGWAILDTINIAESRQEDQSLSERLSPGQKALYFFWYLDGQVTNGGFIQFYWNNYREYLPTILNGLALIGDTSMMALIKEADKEYLANENLFALQQEKSDWAPLYQSLKLFEQYDKSYYEKHNNTMALIEKYAKSYPREFVKLQ